MQIKLITLGLIASVIATVYCHGSVAEVDDTDVDIHNVGSNILNNLDGKNILKNANVDVLSHILSSGGDTHHKRSLRLNRRALNHKDNTLLPRAASTEDDQEEDDQEEDDQEEDDQEEDDQEEDDQEEDDQEEDDQEEDDQEEDDQEEDDQEEDENEIESASPKALKITRRASATGSTNEDEEEADEEEADEEEADEEEADEEEADENELGDNETSPASHHVTRAQALRRRHTRLH
ncbi:hypothetical protein K501DRAFT_313047 [Backusella circina FSU 941]|nr:hypothetical protein K501DRAFT_313047 [Backusella circina FSU 941]